MNWRDLQRAPAISDNRRATLFRGAALRAHFREILSTGKVLDPKEEGLGADPSARVGDGVASDRLPSRLNLYHFIEEEVKAAGGLSQLWDKELLFGAVGSLGVGGVDAMLSISPFARTRARGEMKSLEICETS